VTISSYYAYNGNSCPVLASLLQNRPVIVSIDGANTYWQFYRSGILNNCGPSNTLNHGVQVIGLYSFANGTSYYVIKNSWGSGWGEMGKMRIDRNVQNGNLCLICSYIYYSIL
jgi:C1A family cysteine protease